MRLNHIFILGLLIAMGTSCVSKKKFVEMETSKLNAEAAIKELKDEIANRISVNNDLKREFNVMKNELHRSNASKSAFIDSLSAVLANEVVKGKKKDADITGQIYTFQTEKRQLKRALKRSGDKIAEMSEIIKNKTSKMEKMKKDAIELKFELNNRVDDISSLKHGLKMKEKEIAGVAEQLEKLNAETAKLKAGMSAKDDEIEKLSNQVKLLRKELGY